MSVDPKLTPLKPVDAKQLARVITEDGFVEISGHAQQEMRNDNLATTDCLNLLRAGVFDGAEFVAGEWRYRVSSKRICIVITLVSAARLRVVTAWRINQ